MVIRYMSRSSNNQSMSSRLAADAIPRNYHRVEDVAEALDMECVIRSADFAVAVAVAWLRGEADPLAIV